MFTVFGQLSTDAHAFKAFFDAGEYFEAGSKVAESLVAFTGGPVDESVLPPIPHPHVGPKEVEAAEIVAGLMMGLVEKDNQDALAECFYDFDEFVYDIDAAWKMIATKSFVGLINGFDLLASTVATIPRDLENCYAAKEDVAAVEKWAAQFLHPKDLVGEITWNIEHHLPSLGLDLAKAKMMYANQEYYEFGEELGIMLAIVTVPHVEEALVV